jgi:hypothetical protein
VTFWEQFRPKFDHFGSMPVIDPHSLNTMKKSTTTKTPAPEKPAAPKGKTSSPKTEPAAKEPVTRKKPAAVKQAPAKAEASAKAKSGATTVAARADIGFGNLLFVRGDGPGLSWERGIPMTCNGSDTWEWTSNTASKAFSWKVLINDQIWSVGDDYQARPGERKEIRPEFQ